MGKSEKQFIDAGRAYLAQNDAKAATIEFKNALGKSPNASGLRLLLGTALLESGDPVAAILELQKAQELGEAEEKVSPPMARAMLLAGEDLKLIAQFGTAQLATPLASSDLRSSVAAAYIRTGDLAKAEESIQASIRATPDFTPALVLQARLMAVQGNHVDALKVLADVLAREAGNERAGILKGELQWRALTDEAGAEDSFRRVLAANPKSLGASTALISLLFQQGKTSEAKAQLATLTKLAPLSPETLFHQAQIAFAEGDYKRAREVSDRVLKAVPAHLGLLELSGAAEFHLRNYVLAESFLSRAVKGAPAALIPRHMLAQTYLITGQPAKAMQTLEPVLANAKVDGATLALAAQTQLQLGNAANAEALYQRAAKAAPEDPRVLTSVAMAQFARGNSGSALKELARIAEGDKGTRADLALISGHLRSFDVPAALKAVDRLQAKVPDRPLPHHLRGTILLVKKDIPAARAAFDAALGKDGKYFPAVASLAAIELMDGKPELARKRFEALLKADPRNYQAMQALAELSQRTGGSNGEVSRLLREAVRIAPTTPVTHLTLINQLLAIGDGKQALQAAQTAAATIPADLPIMDALGRAQIAAGDGQQAISTFKKLAALQPDNPSTLLRLADAYSVARDPDGAARTLRKALEIDPDLLMAKRALVRLSLLARKPDEGLAIARDIQAKHGKQPLGFSLEGDLEVSRGNWDRAASAYRAALQRGRLPEVAIKLHGTLLSASKQAEADRLAADWLKTTPADPMFNYYLGGVAIAKGQFDTAEHRYTQVLKAQPDHALAMNNMAWLMARQGKPGALAMAARAHKMLPENPSVLDTLATALAADKQFSKAVEIQQGALARSPKDPILKLNLAKLLVQNNQKAEARAALRELAALGDVFSGQAEVAALLRTL